MKQKPKFNAKERAILQSLNKSRTGLTIYEIAQIKPLLKGLKEISNRENREWLMNLDLSTDEIIVNFSDGAGFKYLEK